MGLGSGFTSPSPMASPPGPQTCLLAEQALQRAREEKECAKGGGGKASPKADPGGEQGRGQRAHRLRVPVPCAVRRLLRDRLCLMHRPAYGIGWFTGNF